MPRKQLTPPDQTVIFAGFRKDLELVTVAQFVREAVGPALYLDLEGRNPMSITGGKVYINFKNAHATSQAVEIFSNLSAKEICAPRERLEIWVKGQGRSNSKYSLLDTVAGNEHGQPDQRPTESVSSNDSDDEENDRGEFEVHLNQSVVSEISGGKSIEEFAEDFASWNPDEETSREFKLQDIEGLLSKIEQDDSTVQVIGFNEFPYSAGNKLKGNNREVEREYWLHLKNVDKRIAGEDNLAILHVHYRGKWHPVPRHRDRSIISQVNIRHTAKTREKAFHMKCTDLNKWREKHGSSVLRQIPKDGWRWRDDGSRCRAVQKVLMGAERCTKQVRSLDMLGKNCVTGSGLRRALIIAVKKYDCDKIPNLANAIHDGAKLEAVLQQLGWEVELETNLELSDAEERISQFVGSVEDNTDACLFAFVGHGIEVNGKQYLVPRDARLGDREYRTHEEFEKEVQRRCIQFDTVRMQLGDARDASEPTIFVLDCCRNDFCKVREQQSRSLPLSQKPSGAVVTEVENSIIVFSTTSGSTADDGPAGLGGPFMSVFVDEISKEGKDLDEALMQTRKRVRDMSSTCQLAPSTSLLYGKFYFSPAALIPPVSQPAFAGAASAGDVLQRIISEDAREFWRENFHQDEEVGWSSFSAALQADFPDLPPTALAEIKQRIDHDDDGRIHAREFNIFTKRAGLREQVQSIARQHRGDGASGQGAGGTPTAATVAGSDRSFQSVIGPVSNPNDQSSTSPSPVARSDSFSAPKFPEPSSDPNSNEQPGSEKPIPSAPTPQKDPYLPVASIAPAAITYLGTGAVLGGQKLRNGSVELNCCWVTVLRERGDAKDPLYLGDCTVLRNDKIDAGRTLEIVPSKGKNVVFSMATVAERDKWFEGLNLCKRLLEEASKVNVARFSERSGELVAIGSNQLVCTVPRTQHGSVAHALSKLPLSVQLPFFEVHLRELGSGDDVSLGVSAEVKGRQRGHAGRLAGEVGLQSDGVIYLGSGRGSILTPAFQKGDRLGCGAVFDSGGRAQSVFFTHNGEIVFMAPSTSQNPLVALTGKGTRVDLVLGLPAPLAAEDYAKRCQVESTGGAVSSFGSLAEAMSAAKDGDTVTLKPGRYYLTETLELSKAITVRALERGKAEIIKSGAGVAVSSQAGTVVLSGVVIRCEGGDVRARASEPGGALALAVTAGSCRLEQCIMSCPRGSGISAHGGALFCSGCTLGPSGRHGVIAFKSSAVSIETSAFQSCAQLCLALNSGSKAELVGCTLRSSKNAVCIMSDVPNLGVSFSITDSAFTAEATGGTAIYAKGEQITAAVIKCRITGFDTAAFAMGRDTKLSFRDCEVAQCGRGFAAHSDGTVVRVDCKLDAFQRPDETASGGRVVDA